MLRKTSKPLVPVAIGIVYPGSLKEQRRVSVPEMKNRMSNNNKGKWPERPKVFPDLMTPIEAAMFVRLDQTGHTPKGACRTLNYWRYKGDLKATKYARRVWYLRDELEAFLKKKTEA